jgi:hypothetical protein
VEIVAVDAATLVIIIIGLLLTWALFGALVLAQAVGAMLAQPLRQIPAVGGSIASWMTDRVGDMAAAVQNKITSWYNSGAGVAFNLASAMANNERRQAYNVLNLNRVLASAVLYLWGTAVTGVGAATGATIGTATQSIYERVEADLRAGDAATLQTANGYTQSVGNWAYGAFVAIDGAIGQTIDRERADIAGLTNDIRATQIYAANVAAQSAGVALQSAERELSLVNGITNARIDAVQGSLTGAIHSESLTRQADISTLQQQLSQFELQSTALLTAHILPAVQEIEKVGTECLDNLCGGPGNVVGGLLNLLAAMEAGALIAFLAEAIRNPEQAAGEAQAIINTLSIVPREIAKTTFGIG